MSGNFSAGSKEKFADMADSFRTRRAAVVVEHTVDKIKRVRYGVVEFKVCEMR